jgi:hypothetical protein
MRETNATVHQGISFHQPRHHLSSKLAAPGSYRTGARSTSRTTRSHQSIKVTTARTLFPGLRTESSHAATEPKPRDPATCRPDGYRTLTGESKHLDGWPNHAVPVPHLQLQRSSRAHLESGALVSFLAFWLRRLTISQISPRRADGILSHG